METTRQAKISRLIQKELSEIFRLETAQMRGTLVSVSQVRVSPDLSVARVYLSIFPSDRSQAVLENLERQSRTIRYDSLDYIDNIDHLLAKDAPAETPAGTADK